MGYYEYVLTLALVNGLIAVSYQHVLASGIMQTCQAALVGVGAYASALASRDWHWPFLGCLALGGLTALVAGVPLSILALRLGDFFFAIATLGFAQVLVVYLYNSDRFGGAVGFVGQPLNTTLWWAAACLAAALGWLVWLQNSPHGHRSRGVAADPISSAALGIDVKKHRVIAFAVSSGLAGVGGALSAHLVGVLVPSDLAFPATVTFLVMVVLGGSTTPIGAVVGAFVITALPEILSASASLRLLIYGMAVLAMMALRPRGLFGRRRLPAPQRVIEASGEPQRATERTESTTATAGVLEVRHVAKSFGGLRVLTDVEVMLYSGQIHGIIGPNGAGKTTLLNIVSGLDSGDSGRVVLDGADITDTPIHLRARLGIARTFQHTRLFSGLTCYENLLVAASARRERSGSALTARRSKERAAWRMLDRVGLTEVADVEATTLSYGLQRRVELARALMSSPRFLLLDEPAAGIPDDELPGLADLIDSLATDGLGILIIEHNLPLIRRLCGSLSVIDGGVVISSGEVAECLEHPQTIAAYLGTPVANLHNGGRP